MPPDVRATRNAPIHTLGETIRGLLQLAEEGRWDDLAQYATEVQGILEAAIKASNSPENSATQAELAETLNNCEHLKRLCQERREQIAPLIEKLDRIASRRG